MIGGKRVLAVVPARGGSKGIPHKNLLKVGGISLVGRVGSVVAGVSAIDRGVVSTDDEAIAAEAERFGLAAPFRRPPELSGDRIGDLEVLQHAIITMEQIDDVVYDYVVMLQPTSPLRTVEHVVQTITKLHEEELETVWTITPVDSKYHPLKQIVLDGAEIQLYDEGGRYIIARQQLSQTFVRNGGAYGFTRTCLLDQKTIYGSKWGYILVEEPMISIDTLDDVSRVEEILSRRRV